MQCWICGKDADSGEHLIKASDLKMIFGKVRQDKPLYMHTDAQRNIRVAGLQSNKLKYEKVICRDCNSSRTQASDKAWELLSRLLQNRTPAIKAGSCVRLAKFFPGTVNKTMTLVQLFFVKQFGCLISEHNIPLDTASFREAILNVKPHPEVYLRFLTGLEDHQIQLLSRSPVNAIEKNGKVCFATWIYMVDRIAVNVVYAGEDEFKERLRCAFHPLRGTRVIRFQSFDE